MGSVLGSKITPSRRGRLSLRVHLLAGITDFDLELAC